VQTLPAPQFLQNTSTPQLLVTVPQTASGQVTDFGSGVQTQLVPSQDVPPGQVPLPQVTVWPQEFTPLPQDLPAQGSSGEQTHCPDPLQLYDAGHPEPHPTLFPQLSVTLPHSREPQGLPAGVQPQAFGSLPPPQVLAPEQLSVCVIEPPLHASFVQGFPSSTGRGTCETPLPGLQESTVHGLPSSTAGADPGWQLPDPLQVSSPLQEFPSEQGVPAPTGGWLHDPALQTSFVQGFPSWQSAGAEQPEQPAIGLCLTPLAGSQLSLVQGSPSSTLTGV
jgi:hypothetical protein